MPHRQLLWPTRSLPTTAGRAFRKVHVVHPTQIFFDLSLNLQLPDFGHKGDQVRKFWGQREANHHYWKSTFTGRFFWGAGPSCLPSSQEQRLPPSAGPPPGPAALWPTSQSPVTEPLTLISGDSLFWPHRERTQSESLTLNLFTCCCVTRSIGFFIFLCSTLAADSNDSKLGPTF